MERIQRTLHEAPITRISLVIMSIVFVLSLVMRYMLDINETTTAILLGAYVKSFISVAHEYWRFLTSGFVHVNLIHFLANAISLFSIGPLIERLYSRKVVLFMLLGSIIFGSMFLFVTQDNVLALGISGGIYGLLGVFVVWMSEHHLTQRPEVRSQLFSIIAINLMINFMPGIGVMAHLGGLIFGVLCGWIFSQKIEWSQLRKRSVIALGALTLILVVLIVQRQQVDQMYLGDVISVLAVLKKFGLGFYYHYLFSCFFG